MSRRSTFPTSCRHPGCPALCREPFCSEHQAEANKAEWQHRSTRSNRVVYNSARWRRVRTAYLAEHPFCERCAREDRIEAANLVHHLQPIEDGGEPFDEANLEALCGPACHGPAEAEARRLSA
jgi:5-methylcytosine-specific restriction protein A